MTLKIKQEPLREYLAAVLRPDVTQEEFDKLCGQLCDMIQPVAEELAKFIVRDEIRQEMDERLKRQIATLTSRAEVFADDMKTIRDYMVLTPESKQNV